MKDLEQKRMSRMEKWAEKRVIIKAENEIMEAIDNLFKALEELENAEQSGDNQ